MPEPASGALDETVHEPGEEYVGPARVVAGDTDTSVRVQLRGHVEPIDGLFHWYGRIAADPQVGERHSSGDTVTLVTPHGQARGRLSDLDPWGRFRIAGTGRPPF
jgi:hypothetical protein